MLRAVFGFSAAQVLSALRGFAGLPTVRLEAAGAVAQAIDWAERGLDFADALHLAAAQAHDGFISFDKALARTVRKLGTPPVSEP